MSPNRHAAGARTRYPVLATAVERHLGWARDFAMAGDVDSSLDAIRDAHATFAELRAHDRAGAVGEPSFVAISRMTERELLSELRAIAETSANAAGAGGSEAHLLEAYESLRARATALARAHGWATGIRLAYQTFEDERRGDR